MSLSPNPTWIRVARHRALGVVIAGVVAVAAWPAQAQESDKPALSLDQVINTIRGERRAVSEENQTREQRFRERRAEQQAELTRIREQVEAAEAEAARLEGVRNDNALQLKELKAQLAERQGEFGELFGAARAAAADLQENVADSLISAQFPGRGEALSEIARADTLPTAAQLETLWLTLLEEAGQQAEVVRFQATLVGTDNQSRKRSVTRVGPFVALADGRFLQYTDGALRELPRQPGGPANAAAARLTQPTGASVVGGVIDPSLGSLLGLVVASPTLRERIDQGGSIGYAIIVVALAGMLLGLYKWLRLLITSRQVAAQMRSSSPSSRNPLGRVLQAYTDNRDADLETLQLKLEDAVLRETPRLDSGLTVVKVLAAVTPLMGLLGTVIGMIVTFQAITLFGTGDPKLMAGGISQALVTTVLGLIAAIPLLLLHAFAANTSRRLAQVLEAQSAGLVADYAETGDTPGANG